jgi:uncharacterized membrane protein
MGYYLDLSKIPINEYREKLRNAHLPPGRIILKMKIDDRFESLKKAGAVTVRDLLILLRNKTRIIELIQSDSLTEEYLTVLLREINSIHPKPNKISDFADILPDTVQKLEAIGITGTVKLYDKVLTAQSRETLSAATGVSIPEINKLAMLTDISRVKYAGATFAYMLYELGYNSVAKIAAADPVKMHSQINQLVTEKDYYKGTIGLNDIMIFINMSKELPQEMSFREN